MMKQAKVRTTRKGIMFKVGLTGVTGETRAFDVFIGKTKLKNGTIMYPVSLCYLIYKENGKWGREWGQSVWYTKTDVESLIKILQQLIQKKLQ